MARQALEHLREIVQTADSDHCPKDIGLLLNLCDFSETCDCMTCWLTAINIYLKGVIELDRADS